MNAIHLTESSSVSITDIERCSSTAQATFLTDTVARKVVGRLGDQILDKGLVSIRENVKDHSLEIFTNLYVIPPEYGNDILRFAQDVVKAHQKQVELDSAS